MGVRRNWLGGQGCCSAYRAGHTADSGGGGHHARCARCRGCRVARQVCPSILRTFNFLRHDNVCGFVEGTYGK